MGAIMQNDEHEGTLYQDPWADPPRRDLLVTEEKMRVFRAYHQTFDNAAGQLVLADMEKAYGRRRSFTPDPYITAFREGQRDAYLRIIDILTRKPGEEKERSV